MEENKEVKSTKGKEITLTIKNIQIDAVLLGLQAVLQNTGIGDIEIQEASIGLKKSILDEL